MEDRYSPLSWDCCNYQQDQGIEELKQSLLHTTMELEKTILSAREEIARKEAELIYVKDLLRKAIKERDEAREKWRGLVLEDVILLRNQQREAAPPLSRSTCSRRRIEDELIRWGEYSKSSDGSSPWYSNESIVLSPTPVSLPIARVMGNLLSKKALPEKGKLLQAVMEAGPSLQTLLVAEPLPRWRNPPSPLDSIEIPPVSISSPTPKLLRLRPH